MKVQFKNIVTCIALSIGFYFVPFAYAQTIDQPEAYAEIRSPDLSNFACGAGPQTYPFTFVNLITHEYYLEWWEVRINGNDSWPDLKDLVITEEPQNPGDCYPGRWLDGYETCIINVTINPKTLSYCTEGTKVGTIDRLLYVSLPIAQPSAEEPIQTEMTKKGNLGDWSFLGPIVANDTYAPNAFASRNVGFTDQYGYIDASVILAPGAAFYSWDDLTTIHTVANLEGVFSTYYGYLPYALQIPNDLGDTNSGRLASVNAGYYRFTDEGTNPQVTVDGKFTIHGDANSEAVFILDFRNVPNDAIVFNFFENSRIDLVGGIQPDNVTWIIKTGSIITGGNCILAGDFLINGGFQDNSSVQNKGCMLSGRVFIYEDNNENSNNLVQPNIYLYGTQGNTP